jgi:hypothetical protein
MASAYVEIPLSGQKAAGRVALIDIDDYELVIKHTWNVLDKTRNGKVYRTCARTNVRVKPGYGGQATLFMHKLITGYQETDHKNRDALDNRRSNLRDGSDGKNSWNRGPHRGGSSPYLGVSWYKSGSKWTAHIRNRTLGYFFDEAEAAKAYDAAARTEYGEYACLNFSSLE